MKKCISCGAELSDNAKFCASCGAKQTEQKIVCPQCGAELPAVAKFCAYCGTPIGQAQAPMAPTKEDAATINRRKIEEAMVAREQEEERRKAAEAEAARIKADEEFRRALDEFEAKRVKELRAKRFAKIKGVTRYNSGDDIESAYQWLYAKEIEDEEKKIAELRARVDRAISQDKLTWAPLFCMFADPELFGRPKREFDTQSVKYAILDDSILVVRGSGALPRTPNVKHIEGNDWQIVNDVILEDTRTKIIAIVFVGNITEIGSKNFMKFKWAKHIVLPDSVKRIGFCAFLAANSLEYVHFPANLQRVSDGAFMGANLHAIILPPSTETLESEAFRNNSNLKVALVPVGTSVDKDTFRGCDEL